MAIQRIIFAGGLLLAALSVQAQNSRGDVSPETQQQATAPRHERNAYSTHRSRVKGFHWRRRSVRHTAEYEFYKRVEVAAREHQRTLRKLHRRQYFDFMYYGHRRKPKKHSADKLRYCKECGIRH